MSKKILVLANPIINSHPGYAANLSIILKTDSGYQWFLQHYFELFSIYEKSNNALLTRFSPLDYIRYSALIGCQPENIFCPAIKCYSIPRYSINDSTHNIIDIVRYFINKEAYLFLYVERKEIEIFKTTYPHTHETFLYGYDDDEKRIYLADYLSNNQYTYFSCSYQEFIKAYTNSSSGREEDRGAFYVYWEADKLNVLQHNENYNYEFKKDLFLKKIDYHLGNKQYQLNYTPIIHDIKSSNTQIYWGIQTVQVIGEYITSCMLKQESVDLRQTAIQVDHKKVIVEIINYLGKTNTSILNLKDVADQLLNITSTLQNVVIKYNLTKNSTSMQRDKIYSMIDNIKNIETKILQNTIIALNDK